MKKNILLLLFALILSAYFPVEEVFARAGGGQSYEDKGRAADREITQIVDAAKIYAGPYGRTGDRCEFRFTKRVRDYATVDSIPKDERRGEIETIILKKINGKWVGQVMGTCFAGPGMNWEKRYQNYLSDKINHYHELCGFINMVSHFLHRPK